MYGRGIAALVCLALLGLNLLSSGEPGSKIGPCVPEFLDKIKSIYCYLGRPGLTTRKAHGIKYDVRCWTEGFFPDNVACSSSHLIQIGDQIGNSTKCTAYKNGTTISDTNVQIENCAIINVEDEMIDRHVIVYDHPSMAIVHTCINSNPSASDMQGIPPVVMLKTERGYKLTRDDIFKWNYVREKLGLKNIREFPPCTACIM